MDGRDWLAAVGRLAAQPTGLNAKVQLSDFSDHFTRQKWASELQKRFAALESR